MTESGYLHEAWCPACHVSHPPGTKQCVHCGGRVLPFRPGGVTSIASRGMAMREAAVAPPDELRRFPETARGEDEAAPRAANPLRFGVAALWLVLAVIGAIARTCAERG